MPEPERELVIDPDELRWRFTPSGGPGGQHANRSNTRAELTFDIAGSASLTEAQRERLVGRLGSQVRVVCDEARSQARNRTIAEARLHERLTDALKPEVVRKKKRVPRGVNERRLATKKRRSETKRGRSWKPE